MTEKKTRGMNADRGAELPWDEPCFVFAPGRYYLCMALVQIPAAVRPPHGGDLTALCWRFADTTQTWVCTYRIRWYAKGPDPWDGQDTKTWTVGKLHADEAEAEGRFMSFVSVASLAAGAIAAAPAKINPFWIRGDYAKLLYLFESGRFPDWLHCRREGFAA